MSQLLDDLIRQKRDGTAVYEEFLRQAEELARQMAGKSTTGAYPAALHGHPLAIVLFNNLGPILQADSSARVVREPSPGETQRLVELALNIDRAMREQAPAGWKGDDTREKQVLNALFPLLNRDRRATMAVFEIIKNQPGPA
jgi:type I restriction enzyme R subunit